MAFKNVLGFQEARLDLLGVLGGLFHELLGVGGMVGDLAGAVHVERHGGIAHPGELFRAAAGIVVMAPPFMDHQHAGAFAFDTVVVGDIAGKGVTVDAVFDFFRHNRRGGFLRLRCGRFRF